MSSAQLMAQTSDSSIYKVKVRNIQFEGNKITKEFVIRREMSIQEGDSIKIVDLNRIVEYNRQRILNSQLFLTVDANIKNWNENGVDLVYKVKELFYWNAHPFLTLADRNFNVWWDDYNHRLNRLNIGTDLTRKNFRGRAEEVGIEGQVGFNKHIYLYYANPYIDKTLKNGIMATVVFNTGKEVQARTDSNKQIFFRDELNNPYKWFRSEFSYLYRPKYASIHEFTIGYQHYSLTQKMFNEQPNFLMGRMKMGFPELRYRYKFNNCDDRNYPTDGWQVECLAEHKGLGLVKGFNQWQLYTHLAYYQPIYKSFSAAFHFRGRLFGPDVQPYFNYRAMGYENDYVRGYEYYIIDGSHYGIVRTDLRQKIFQYTFHQDIIPLLKIIPCRVFVKAFGDIGYVQSNNFGNSFLNNEFLHGQGVGLDIVLSYYLKLRLEYSFNGLNEKGLFLHLRNE